MSSATGAGPGQPATLPEVDDDLVQRVAALQAAERERLRGTLDALLVQQRGRIEYAEGRRGAVATTGGVALAAGLAGLMAAARSNDFTYFPAWLAMLTLTGMLVLTGAATLWLHGRQTNWPYPFHAAALRWKHFYVDALPPTDEVAPAWHTRQSSRFRSRSADRYSSARQRFLDRAVSLHDEPRSIAQDIEQSYVLAWSEMYKTEFLTALRSVLARGIVASLVLGAIAFGAAAWLDADRFDDHRDPPPAEQTR